MRRAARGVAVLGAVAGLAWVVACGSSTGPVNVSLAGSYTLTSFTEQGQPVPGTTGTLALTDSTYAVDIVFPQNAFPEIVDSGTYVATDSGSFSESSSGIYGQSTGTYTYANNVLAVSLTSGGIAVTQSWQKQ